jgi:hypothetical protein
MRATFPERLERVLIGGMVVGIVLILQRFSLPVFQMGLSILVVSTLLQIAVGNIPKNGNVGKSLIRIVFLLCIIAAVFAVGILLVPTLSHLGR